ncbi:collagen-like protein [Crocinitomicaceae bacterium]|nr:collagen-like protein [Crocinitomicaceae bacterium]
MIEGKNFGIHISGIRDGHSPHIFSTQANSKEFDDIFMDIRTGVNKIDQSHFFKVHQTTNYSVASLVTTGFRDRGGRPGAYITVSLFTKRGMMFSTSPRKKLIELLSFYKLKQGNNFESNQFTSNGLLEVIGDLPVEHNKMKATPQKVSGFALYQDETHIDKYLKFNGGALAYGHYYFLPIAAKEKMTSFKSEISNLFGFEGNNSRLNDLYKAAPKPPISTGGPGRQGTSGGSGNPGTSGGSGKPGTTGGSGLPDSTGSSKNSKNWNKMLIPVLGISIIGFVIWLVMILMGDDGTQSSPPTSAGNKKTVTDTSSAITKNKDEFDQRVDSLMNGTLTCPEHNLLRSGKHANSLIVGRKLKYSGGKWYWDNNKDSPASDAKIETDKHLFTIFEEEVAEIDEIEASSNGGGSDDGGRGTGGGNSGGSSSGAGGNTEPNESTKLATLLKTLNALKANWKDEDDRFVVLSEEEQAKQQGDHDVYKEQIRENLNNLIIEAEETLKSKIPDLKSKSKIFMEKFDIKW